MKSLENLGPVDLWGALQKPCGVREAAFTFLSLLFRVTWLWAMHSIACAYGYSSEQLQ